MSADNPTREANFIRQRVAVDGNGCWIWQGAINAGGYGRVPVRKGNTAHRLSYRTFVGPIPEGLQLDHLCRVRACCNPEHLEPVTSRENTFRGQTPAALNAAKTHCPQGHPFEGENVYHWQGRRFCKTCKRRTVSALRLRRRLAAKS